MNIEETKDRFFNNSPVFIDNIPIYSPLLESIFDISEQKYISLLGLCLATKEKLGSKYSAFDNDFTALWTFLEDNSVEKEFLKGVKFFTGLDFKKNIIKDDVVLSSTIEEEILILHKFNFLEFQNVIRIANGVKVENKPKPKTKYEREVEEAKKRMEQKLGKKVDNKESEEVVTIRDLASSLCIMSKSYNLFNIGKLTMFMFLDQLKRSQAYEKFDMDIRSILAGADSKDLDLKYYITNLDKD
jgi:hypothetical protein